MDVSTMFSEISIFGKPTGFSCVSGTFCKLVQALLHANKQNTTSMRKIFLGKKISFWDNISGLKLIMHTIKVKFTNLQGCKVNKK